MRPTCIVLLPTRVFGGHERMLVEWLRHAADQGLEARIYSARNEPLLRECQAAGLGRPEVSHPGAASAARDFLATWRLLARLPRDVPVLLAPGVLQAAPLQWLAAFLQGRRVAGYVPMAYSSRRMGLRGGALRDWLVARVVRRFDLWITICEEQRDLLVRQWRVTAPVLVLPNRLSLGAAAVRRGTPDRAGELRVLFAGRFDANQKGLDWLSGVLRRRCAQWQGRARFTFMGQGPYAAALAALAEELRGVRVLPWGDVRAALREADVLLLPSRFEGVPLVALEATHYGVPVLGSRQAGLAGLVPAASLFDFGDEAGLWRALHDMADPGSRAAALAHARARLQQVAAPEAFHRGVRRVVGTLGCLG